MKIKALGEFMAFTYLFRHCRPNYKDFFVYDVDAGKPTEHNIVIKAMKIEGDTFVGDPVELIIAKEWVLENIEKILTNARDSETASS